MRLLGATQRDFRAVQPAWVDRQTRHYLIALPYLLGCFTDLRPLGNYKRVALAEKVFGLARVQAIVTRVATVLCGWGYQNAQTGRAFPRILCETLLLNRSPRLHDLSPTLLDDLRRTAGPEKYSLLHQLQRALATLGVMDAPPAPVVPRPAVEGVPASWQGWGHRWETTSTLTAATRRHVRLCLLKAGRWLAAEHPAIQEPAAWTRELCAAYVAAVDRMRVGDYAQRRDPIRDRLGTPLSARSKEAYLGAMRQFFRDVQEWAWIPRRFDPTRALATPRAVKALIGPAPRVIADDVWAKLLWAGLQLEPADLVPSARARYCYPVELVRALAVTWLFTGLRSDEIARLRVGCIRWHTPPDRTQDPVCLLDVPAHKTGTPFTKPVDPLVGRAVSSYEVGRALGITQKSAWFMGHRIRAAMRTGTFAKFSGEVEADETFIGGKARFMHKAKRAAKIKGTGSMGKTAVMGLLERHGPDGHSIVSTKVVPNVRRRTLAPEVRAHVEPGSDVFTDALKSYDDLDREYVHGVIDHAEAYARGRIHTNGLENFWSLLKRAIKGTYVSVEPWHLFRYLDEESFRYNERHGHDGNRFMAVLGEIVGRRLTYKGLTGKTLPVLA